VETKVWSMVRYGLWYVSEEVAFNVQRSTKDSTERFIRHTENVVIEQVNIVVR